MSRHFDTGRDPSKKESERFYHGFALGLMVEPRNQPGDAVILEFKVQDGEEEKELSDTVKAALEQIEKYTAALIAKGIPKNISENMDSLFMGKKY